MTANPAPGYAQHPGHTIVIEPCSGRIVAVYDGQTLAASDRVLTLREAHYPAVYYIPLDDVRQGLFRPSDHGTYCPFKGQASYWSLVGKDGAIADEGVNAVWGYENPYDECASIRGHVAFYQDRLDAIGPAES